MDVLLSLRPCERPRGMPSRRSLRLGALVLPLLLMAPAVASADTFKLSEAAPSFADVLDFKISPDGRWVVYRHDAEVDEARQLYSVPLAGGTPVRLCGILPSGSAVRRFCISPDSTRVGYIAGQDPPNLPAVYSVPIAGPAWAGVKLNNLV